MPLALARKPGKASKGPWNGLQGEQRIGGRAAPIAEAAAEPEPMALLLPPRQGATAPAPAPGLRLPGSRPGAEVDELDWVLGAHSLSIM
mmetsp:Transcript_9702/g.21714  ORF Transcript_9702/g.21714 Transcript_9702/m.21714 type:complete len:89 (-) Transcript_9702:1510-1776(-)